MGEENMSDHADKMIRYEELNWADLAEKFIEKNRLAWEDFVFEEYEKYEADRNWEPDYEHE